MRSLEAVEIIADEIRERIRETEVNNRGDACWSPTLDDVEFAQTRIAALQEMLTFVEGYKAGNWPASRADAGTFRARSR